MPHLTFESIQVHRARTFRCAPELRLRDKDEAIEFVRERGFTFFWPIRDALLPSLWTAVAGDRPVASDHDDPGHVTWGWKDSSLGQRAWYYAKVLRKRGTLISMDVVPYFYALSRNYGCPEEDYLQLYEDGLLAHEAMLVYEAILEKGPLHTIELRERTGMISKQSAARFDRALADLQADFKIVPVGVAAAGSWKYAFIYDVAARHYPELIESARMIDDDQAQQRLAELYFQSVGAATARDISKLFGWTPTDVQRTLEHLTRKDVLRSEVAVDGGIPLTHSRKARKETGWFALADLADNPLTG